MHYGSGTITRCRDVLASEFEFCSDLNTTMFLKRIIQAETPDFIAFTGNFVGLIIIYFSSFITFCLFFLSFLFCEFSVFDLLLVRLLFCFFRFYVWIIK